LNKINNFYFLRINLELAGNTLQGISGALKTPKDENGRNTILKIPYAQYFRTDLDFRYYNYLTERNIIVFRYYMGVGHPYGNSTALPIEKSFYVGGANGIRAWTIRSLGPGGYFNADKKTERIGDMGLESNVEYRFPIYKLLAGALFVDAGNIWLSKTDDINFEKGVFKFDSFINQIAVGTGLGFRFDFSFFIIRTDFAIRVIDPAFNENNKYVLHNASLKDIFHDINLNFGIGYPF